MKIYDEDKKMTLATKLVFLMVLFVFCIVMPIFKFNSLALTFIGVLVDDFIFFKYIKPYFKTISEYRQHVGAINSFDIHLASFFEPYLVNDVIRKTKAKAFVGEKKKK